MRMLMRCTLLLFAGWTLAQAETNQLASASGSAEVSQPAGLPAIGKWMLDSALQPAHWLGEIYRDKSLREPINIILADAVAKSSAEATERLEKFCKAAGYDIREGHSCDYHGLIGGQVYPQLPAGRYRAFSNMPFELDNNHGRIFGPYHFAGAWWFTAAFSRENVNPLEKIKHRYASFNRARDDVARQLDEKSPYRICGFVPLDNALIDDPHLTTGDHDGVAVLLRATTAERNETTP